jgi:hypothetical protein
LKNFPCSNADFPPFSKKIFALVGGLGFHTLYNNDYKDFLDDLIVFKEISDKDKNLYLSIYKEFFLKEFNGLETPLVGISVAMTLTAAKLRSLILTRHTKYKVNR